MLKNSAEPRFGDIGLEHPEHARAWRESMDWTRLETNHNELRDEFVKWAEANKLDGILHFQALPSWHYMTIGRIAYLINRGAVPPDSTVTWFKKKLAALPSEKEVETETDDNNDAPLTAKARKTIDYVNFYSFIDAIIHKYQDDGEKIDELLNERFRKLAPNGPLLKKLYSHFKECLTESINGKDNPFVEKRIAPLILVVNILAAASGNAKVSGPKANTASRKAMKAAEKVTYKVMDSDTNMASVSPSQVPGSKTAVVYNAKTRKVMVYHAKDDDTLDIKGTKIINFNESVSFAKTLRKPKALLPMLRNAVTVRRIEVLFDDIKGKNHSVNGRIGKDMVIVKVLK